MELETIQEAFGWVATGITVVSFLFPVFPYLNVIRGRLNFDDTPSFQVTTCYVNYFCWYVYGDMIFSDQIKYCFMVGCIINLIRHPGDENLFPASLPEIFLTYQSLTYPKLEPNSLLSNSSAVCARLHNILYSNSNHI